MNTSWDAAHELGASVFIVIPCAVQRDAVRDLMAGNCIFRVPDQPRNIGMLHRIRDDTRSCFAHSCAGRDLV